MITKVLEKQRQYNPAPHFYERKSKEGRREEGKEEKEKKKKKGKKREKKKRKERERGINLEVSLVYILSCMYMIQPEIRARKR